MFKIFNFSVWWSIKTNSDSKFKNLQKCAIVFYCLFFWALILSKVVEGHSYSASYWLLFGARKPKYPRITSISSFMNKKCNVHFAVAYYSSICILCNFFYFELYAAATTIPDVNNASTFESQFLQLVGVLLRLAS